VAVVAMSCHVEELCCYEQLALSLYASMELLLCMQMMISNETQVLPSVSCVDK
jgi:hypothetical protein